MLYRIIFSILFLFMVFVFISSCENEKSLAVYSGVENYGAAETNKNNKDTFKYRFIINGKEKTFYLDNGTKDENGKYDYPLQNALKENYTYKIKIINNKIVAADEVVAEHIPYMPPVKGKTGERTIKNFLATALEPVGTTLYVYGGGWNWQDEASAIQAKTVGISQDWLRFFREQDENYTYKEKNPQKSFYPYGGYNAYYYAGLDCSGYLGWVLYNTLFEKVGNGDYVFASTSLAKRLSELGLGELRQDIKNKKVKTGDIVSIKGHVWIVLGVCDDGSIVILHSSPTNSRVGQPGGGVQISAVGSSKDSEAYRLATFYMSKFYPEWYRRYETVLKEPEIYFDFSDSRTGVFSWNITSDKSGLSDKDGFRNMSAAQVLYELFKVSPD
jgi:hypothetical protein